jgi:hypothetical protein
MREVLRMHTVAHLDVTDGSHLGTIPWFSSFRPRSIDWRPRP